ncbi:hypothetical protein [Erythrobacter sp. F6033]|uniref:hypothetical protein n=1 Tax=Erythrobacter sp. F6033 TaxID=2926401 RepID=UPI001FF1F69B|nr:hypothetical protein [Erythrobacter sp. F6033]MCK0128921.1 hypothetical protein [Erythrobacter sp. F6033]
MKIILSALPMAALLTGCVSLSDKQISRFDRMSCSQLAVALDYEQRGQRDAETSGALNSLSGLLSKGEASDRAELDAFADDLDADEHRAAKDYIRDRQDYLDC